LIREWIIFTFADTVSDGRKLVNERKSRRRKNGRKDGPIAVLRIAQAIEKRVIESVNETSRNVTFVAFAATGT
jgi:hypothetical protein